MLQACAVSVFAVFILAPSLKEFFVRPSLLIKAQF